MVDEAFQRGANELECLIERQFDAKSFGVLPIRRRDIRTLRPSQWLNDEVRTIIAFVFPFRGMKIK